MDERIVYRGMYATCPVCGKKWYICDPESWAFKMDVHRKRRQKIEYFCRYTCKRKYEKEYEDYNTKSRENAIKKIKANNGKNRVKKGDGKEDVRLCWDCRYCMEDPLGFRLCSLYSNPLNKQKAACKRFREKYDVGEKKA